jgi:hypothetical protein
VSDPVTLVEIIACTTLVIAPAIVLNRLTDDAEGPRLADLFRIPVDPPWPRGVQEEEPVRWQFDRLEPRSASPDPTTGDCHPRRITMPNVVPHSGLG